MSVGTIRIVTDSTRSFGRRGAARSQESSSRRISASSSSWYGFASTSWSSSTLYGRPPSIERTESCGDECSTRLRRERRARRRRAGGARPQRRKSLTCGERGADVGPTFSTSSVQCWYSYSCPSVTRARASAPRPCPAPCPSALPPPAPVLPSWQTSRPRTAKRPRLSTTPGVSFERSRTVHAYRVNALAGEVFTRSNTPPAEVFTQFIPG
eukprot:6876433-Prymnesium_polylepis.1